MAKEVKDRLGVRYGRLVVIARAENKPDGRIAWLCRCDCGNEKIVAGNDLARDRSRSCGCLVKDTRVIPDIVDRVGQRFGRLLVLKLDETRTSSGGMRWICRCDCGVIKSINGNSMVSGNSRSCGAHKVETAYRTHGQASPMTPEYRAWKAAKSRCVQPSEARYNDYGGRGITMCEEWIDSFEQFFVDMGRRPEGRTLDRIDVDGNYEKSNCRWATPAEQRANKRPQPTHAMLAERDARIAELEALLARQ